MAGVINDPIADMLTRIRNGINARHKSVSMPLSKVKVCLADCLRDEGFIEGYEIVRTGPHPILTVNLKYDHNRECVITNLMRVSRPGLRRYVPVKAIPIIRNGLGISILSTSSGVMTDRVARQKRVGGELVCTVW